MAANKLVTKACHLHFQTRSQNDLKTTSQQEWAVIYECQSRGLESYSRRCRTSSRRWRCYTPSPLSIAGQTDHHWSIAHLYLQLCSAFLPFPLLLKRFEKALFCQGTSLQATGPGWELSSRSYFDQFFKINPIGGFGVKKDKVSGSAYFGSFFVRPHGLHAQCSVGSKFAEEFRKDRPRKACNWTPQQLEDLVLPITAMQQTSVSQGRNRVSSAMAIISSNWDLVWHKFAVQRQRIVGRKGVSQKLLRRKSLKRERSTEPGIRT